MGIAALETLKVKTTQVQEDDSTSPVQWIYTNGIEVASIPWNQSKRAKAGSDTTVIKKIVEHYASNSHKNMERLLFCPFQFLISMLLTNFTSTHNIFMWCSKFCREQILQLLFHVFRISGMHFSLMLKIEKNAIIIIQGFTFLICNNMSESVLFL